MKVVVGDMYKEIEKKEIGSGVYEIDFLELFNTVETARRSTKEELKQAGFYEKEV